MFLQNLGNRFINVLMVVVNIASIDVETDEIVRLFHPRRDVWGDHFVLTAGKIEPLSAIGRVTMNLLQCNRAERISERDLLIQAGVLKNAQ